MMGKTQSTQEIRILQYSKIRDEAFDIFKKKNSDYGDAFADYGSVGVIVRMGDKIRRMSNITSTSITLVEDERLRDTLMDLANYAVMGLMLLDEKKDAENLIEEKVENLVMNDPNPAVHKKWVTGSKGNEYEVAKHLDGSITCTCPAYEHGNGEECKHIKAWKRQMKKDEKILAEAKEKAEEEARTAKTWNVKSWTRNRNNNVYVVKKYHDGSMSCTCKHFKYNGTCKHCDHYNNL
jgi:hypothetical protein